MKSQVVVLAAMLCLVRGGGGFGGLERSRKVGLVKLGAEENLEDKINTKVDEEKTIKRGTMKKLLQEEKHGNGLEADSFKRLDSDDDYLQRVRHPDYDNDRKRRHSRNRRHSDDDVEPLVQPFKLSDIFKLINTTPREVNSPASGMSEDFLLSHPELWSHYNGQQIEFKEYLKYLASYVQEKLYDYDEMLEEGNTQSTEARNILVHKNPSDNLELEDDPNVTGKRIKRGALYDVRPVLNRSAKLKCDPKIERCSEQSKLKAPTSLSEDIYLGHKEKSYKAIGPFRFVRQSSMKEPRRKSRRSERDERPTSRSLDLANRRSLKMKPVKKNNSQRPEEYGDYAEPEPSPVVSTTPAPDYGEVDYDIPVTESAPSHKKRFKLKSAEQPPDEEVHIVPRTRKGGRKKETHRFEFAREPIKGYNAQNGEFNVETSYNQGDEGTPETKGERIKCKTNTELVGSADGERTMDSRGTTYSEIPDDDKKSLICRSETAEVIKANEDVILRHSVSGSSVITQEDNPYKFLDPDYGPQEEILEIGSKSRSTLSSNSNQNQSASIVGTNDKKANSQSSTQTKFVYEDDKVAGIKSNSDTEGSTAGNDGKKIVLTNKQKESSMIVQNPNKHLEKNIAHERDEDVKTYVEHKKKSNFEIVFRMGDES